MAMEVNRLHNRWNTVSGYYPNTSLQTGDNPNTPLQTGNNPISLICFTYFGQGRALGIISADCSAVAQYSILNLPSCIFLRIQWK